jgi:hypothetical protein
VHEVYSKPGEARWFAPVKHRVENVGDTPYNAVYIGMKGKPLSAHAADGGDQETARIVAKYVSSAGR